MFINSLPDRMSKGDLSASRIAAVFMAALLAVGAAATAKPPCEGPVALDRPEPYSVEELDAMRAAAQQIDDVYGKVVDQEQEVAAADLALVTDACELLRRKATVYEVDKAQFKLDDGAAIDLGSWRPGFLNVSAEVEGARLVCNYEDLGLEAGSVLHVLTQAWIHFPAAPRSYYVNFNFGGLIAIDRQGNVLGSGIPSVSDTENPGPGDWNEENCKDMANGEPQHMVWRRCWEDTDNDGESPTSDECDGCCERSQMMCEMECDDSISPFGCRTRINMNFDTCRTRCQDGTLDSTQIILQAP